MKQIMLTLIFLLSVYSYTTAQELPNNGFENWNTNSAKNPIGWGSLNWTAPLFGAPHTCTKTVDTVTGRYALKLETIIYAGDTIDAFAFTGSWPDPNKNPKFGYAYTKRPAKLTGYYKFNSPAGDSCLMVVFLTRWNSVLNKRDSIGTGFFYGQTNSAYNLFEAPIQYTGNGLPDTANVLLLASALTSPERRGIPGNTLQVDDLSYTFSSGLREPLLSDNSFKVYPNPFSDIFHLELQDRLSDIHLKIVDTHGREIYSQVGNSEHITIDLSGYPNGVYFLEICSNNSSEWIKLIKE